MRKTVSTSTSLPTVAGALRRNNQRGRGARRICQKPSGSRTPARARRLAHKGEERREDLRGTGGPQRGGGGGRNSPPPQKSPPVPWARPAFGPPQPPPLHPPHPVVGARRVIDCR